MNKSILVISEDLGLIASLRHLSETDHRFLDAPNIAEGRKIIVSERVEMAIIDVRISSESELRMCEEYIKDLVRKNVIAYLLIDEKVTREMAGLTKVADEFLVKLVTPDNLLSSVKSFLSLKKVEGQVLGFYEKLNLLEDEMISEREKAAYKLKLIEDLRDFMMEMKEKISRNKELAEGYVRLKEQGKQLKREIAERKLEKTRQAAQFALTRIFGEVATLSEALPEILKTICGGFGWELGELWTIDHSLNQLRLENMWYKPSLDAYEFENTSRTITFSRGIGLPGRVWSSRQSAVWVSDVATDSNFPRAAVAVKTGLHGAVAFPLMIKGEVNGVMVFFSEKVYPLDDELCSIMSDIGSRIGSFVNRKLDESKLAERTGIAILNSEVGFAVARGVNLRNILQQCSEALVRNLGIIAFARIWTFNKEENMLELQSSAGIYTHIDGAHSRVPVGMYKIGLIAEERKPHLTNQVIGDPRVHNQEWAKQMGMVAFAGYPLILEDHLVGVIAMFSRKPLTETILETLASVSDVIALGIERKHYESQIISMATRDPLTDLFNRRRFHEELKNRIVQTKRFNTQGALLFMDIDNFKYINDSFGHEMGDRLLVNLSYILKKRLRDVDTVARLGGDEFAIILPNTDEQSAVLIANQLRELITKNVSIIEGKPVGITISIGISLFPRHSEKAECLYSYADLAMYHAKEEGRNRVCVYATEQTTQIESRLIWKEQIREALNQNCFVLYLQPILDIQQNRIVGFEVLLRMIDKKGEIILPVQFINVAERFGLIRDIDHWVVRESLPLAKKLYQKGKPCRLEVNLSGRALSEKKILQVIKERLAETGVDPASLIFEITETSAIQNITAAEYFIIEFKRMGCRFALDDFGIGFSSFNYLKRLPVDYLKIDGSFIQNLAENFTDQHLVKAMVEIAHAMGKKIIAEFVTSEKTLCLLKGFGVDYAQGYFIGKPKPLDELWRST